jgi:hypothetical protein
LEDGGGAEQDEKANVRRFVLCVSGSNSSRREYYEKNNSLIQQYVYIDRLLDSSLPHDLIQEYYNPFTAGPVDVPHTIAEESSASSSRSSQVGPNDSSHGERQAPPKPKVTRTPKNLYRIPDERSPLLPDDDAESVPDFPQWTPEEEMGLGDGIVKFAIYVNLAANTVLLVLKIIVTVLTSSVSVLAALVDAVLDFLSTAIVWTTTQLISRNDDYLYPVGRRRLEPIGVLVFSVIMITSFVQVAFEGFGRLTGGDHRLVVLGVPAIAIMASTVIIKGLCWVWCRLIKNSSVQALAQDAVTDVVFNTFSIIFPLGESYSSFRAWSNIRSWLLHETVVSGLSRRHTAVRVRHLRLVQDDGDPHPEPLWSGSHCRREERAAVPDHAVREDNKADPGASGLPRGRQADRGGRRCIGRGYELARLPRPRGEPAIYVGECSDRGEGVCSSGLFGAESAVSYAATVEAMLAVLHFYVYASFYVEWFVDVLMPHLSL